MTPGERLPEQGEIESPVYLTMQQPSDGIWDICYMVAHATVLLRA